ncbi:hypothetical protein LJB98_05185 [Bacteroidales bacterium OttesenSCG-928-M11]|nr:hypothetical protein [Bacteroidales bacterium OttesenSCG-928-M11]
MKQKIYLFILFFALCLVSCKDKEAVIEVKNSVDNVLLENISINGYGISSRLLPGETGKRVFYEESDDISFPINGHIEFYMISGDSRVYLKTKEVYTLDLEEKLFIDITNKTEVENPL